MTRDVLHWRAENAAIGGEWSSSHAVRADDGFSADLVARSRETVEIGFVPARFHEDPEEARRSVERSAELDFDVLCLAHGPPLTDGPRVLRELLERTV